MKKIIIALALMVDCAIFAQGFNKATDGTHTLPAGSNAVVVAGSDGSGNLNILRVSPLGGIALSGTSSVSVVGTVSASIVNFPAVQQVAPVGVFSTSVLNFPAVQQVSAVGLDIRPLNIGTDSIDVTGSFVSAALEGNPRTATRLRVTTSGTIASGYSKVKIRNTSGTVSATVLGVELDPASEVSWECEGNDLIQTPITYNTSPSAPLDITLLQ
jgi:hypothetical protein